nr:MAG TPA: hypothetical protein [Caudoviricetes sp.]
MLSFPYFLPYYYKARRQFLSTPYHVGAMGLTIRR